MIILNSVEIVPTRFPDNTQQVWKLPDHAFVDDTNFIEWRFESEVELMTLAQIRSLIGREAELVLTIPYLPYARQDKAISNESCFGLTTFMQFLMDNVSPDKIVVFDPHSTEILQTFCNLYNVELEIYLPDLKKISRGYECIIFPDEGASKRYKTPKDIQVVFAEKKRDPLTGEITEIKLPKLRGNFSIVIDDICDGGRTFIELAKNKERYDRWDLYISHGVFSKGQKGVNELYDYYSSVVTTDSIIRNKEESYSGTIVWHWRNLCVNS